MVLRVVDVKKNYLKAEKNIFQQFVCTVINVYFVLITSNIAISNAAKKEKN